jgi:hypothetical protein
VTPNINGSKRAYTNLLCRWLNGACVAAALAGVVIVRVEVTELAAGVTDVADSEQVGFGADPVIVHVS